MNEEEFLNRPFLDVADMYTNDELKQLYGEKWEDTIKKLRDVDLYSHAETYYEEDIKNRIDKVVNEHGEWFVEFSELVDNEEVDCDDWDDCVHEFKQEYSKQYIKRCTKSLGYGSDGEELFLNTCPFTNKDIIDEWDEWQEDQMY